MRSNWQSEDGKCSENDETENRNELYQQKKNEKPAST